MNNDFYFHYEDRVGNQKDSTFTKHFSIILGVESIQPPDGNIFTVSATTPTISFNKDITSYEISCIEDTNWHLTETELDTNNVRFEYTFNEIGDYHFSIGAAFENKRS